MTDAQSHRGPDDSGIEVVAAPEPTVVFGHRRLSIIDLSPAGHQPMHDPDGDCWLTFNGEIYNFRELRRELEGQGQIFRTGTDSEVILKAYAAWGVECVKRLRGIFAFAIWDHPERTLVLARDQLGVKPLYYWHEGDALVFASEVRAVLASGNVPRKLDRGGLRSFLAYGSVQDPYTLVNGVESLPPGHVLVRTSAHVKVSRYWSLPSPASVTTPPSDLLEQVRAKLEDALASQLISDVPLGAFLSGGIDSTAIAALMQRTASRVPRTFSIIFEEKKYDEREFSRLAARHIGTDHSELILGGQDVRDALGTALSAFDQPSMDGLNTYFVSQTTKQAGLTVALSGVGGDELFGGYDSYSKALLVERVGRKVDQIPSGARGLLAKLVCCRLGQKEQYRRLADLLRTRGHPYFISRQVFGPGQVARLLEDQVAASSEGWEPARFQKLQQEASGYDPINRASAFELQTYMLSTLLRDTDQMSMAHALEVRVPLIDHELVEFMFTVPGPSKLDPAWPKPLLTRSLGDALPQECVHRPKRGFELPFATWLRESLLDQMHSTFVAPSTDEVSPFTKQGLATLWGAFERGQLGWSRIWGVFVLRHWLRQHEIRT
jgi:asparagine synthase (glutamine-hydrolysing)